MPANCGILPPVPGKLVAMVTNSLRRAGSDAEAAKEPGMRFRFRRRRWLRRQLRQTPGGMWSLTLPGWAAYPRGR